MKKTLILSFIAALIGINLGFAQQLNISGKVTSAETNESLPFVNVHAVGTASGTVTNADGTFGISVPNESTSLSFSFLGFASQTVAINGRTTIDVMLVPDMQELSEVVVTGYGDRKRLTFTGSAGVVGSESIEDQPLTNIEQALQGSVAGVQLSASSGTPGSIQDIRIRGISSITAGNSPLFVIDGVPVVNGVNTQETIYSSLSIMSSLSPNDIESMTVLKDASATALYGARGANGVIVITTKKGKSGKATISFSTNIGTIDRAVSGPKMLNAPQYAELYYESRVNANQASSIAEAQELYPLNWDGVTDTNWTDVVTNDGAMTKSYDLSMRGGKEKSNYYASLGYMEQDGVNIGVDFNRTTGRFSYDTAVTDKLNFSTSFTTSYVDQEGQFENGSWFGSPNAAMVFLHPIDPVRNEDGSLNLNLDNPYYNPVWVAENVINSKKQVRLLNSTELSYDILDNLTFTSSIGLDFLYTEELNYDPPGYGDGEFVNGYSFGYNNRNFNWTWKNMIDYNISINEKNQLDLKVVYEAQKNNYQALAVGGSDIAAEGLIYPGSIANVAFHNGFVEDWSINSVMGLATYTWRDNVIIDATLRREGNSRFQQDNRWGTFYSVGGAWVFSEESFIKDNADWLNLSKLRVSYGKTGNASIGLNQYQAFLGFGGSYNNQAGSFPTQFGNENLGWENNKSYNLALDFGFFDRITGSLEYFNRNTYDLLLDVPLSSTTGFTSQTQNIGEMINTGWEVTMNADIIKSKNFNWNLGFNFTTVENEVTKLPKSSTGEELTIETLRSIVTEGESAYAWYLPTWAGVNPDNGLPQWFVEGKDGAVTSNYSEAAKSIQGNTAPTFFGGLNMRLDYKNLYLTSNLYYSTGNKVYDVFAFYARSDGASNFNLSSGYEELYDRWQQPGDIAPNPQNVYQNAYGSTNQSTRNLHDGEYLRLRDLTLGYNLPSKFLANTGISNLHFFLKGTNIWTKAMDDSLQYDPEVGANALLLLNTSPIKTYVFGLNISL